MQNVATKMHIENNIKSIFNMYIATFVLFKDKDRFIF